MKKFSLAFFVMVITMSFCKNAPDNKEIKTNSNSMSMNFDTTKLKSGDKYFQCSMDPEILSEKAGECSKCGMELSEMKKK